MTSPENEQHPASDSASEVAGTPGTEPTQEISTTAPPTAAVPVQPPTAAVPVQPPTEQAPPAPQAPIGWGHPTPGQAPPNAPAIALPTGPPTGPPIAPAGTRDPFALLSSYPAPAPSAAEADAAPVALATRRPQRLWVTIVGTAAVTALVTSFAVVGITNGFGGNDGAGTPASLATIGTTSNDTAPVSGSTSNNPNWEKVASAVAESVVSIQVTTASGGAQGSGFILDAAGHVLTNNHVVAGATGGSVDLTLSDGRIYTATIVGTDATTDLAVVLIKDPPTDLKPASLGDSSTVVVGEPVMAVGNPLGLANTATTGIVSAVDRPASASGESSNVTVVTNAIQIDAAINPGNSGGPLFDAKGQVVGITSSIATLSGGASQSGSIGLGFAIPINLAQNIAGQLIKSGTAEHAYLGVGLTDGSATADGTKRLGAVIAELTAGSPAAKGGIKKGDVVVAIDGHPVGGAESLTAYVRERTAGSTAKLTVVRDGKAIDLTVTLAAKAATPTQTPSSTPSSDSSGGSGSSGDQNPFGQFFGGQG